MDKGKDKAMNQCVECGKFKKWEELTETRFVPDHEDGSGSHGEEQEFTCDKCLNKSKNNPQG